VTLGGFTTGPAAGGKTTVPERCAAPDLDQERRRILLDKEEVKQVFRSSVSAVALVTPVLRKGLAALIVAALLADCVVARDRLGLE
jgi:hypothetical protein